MARQLTRANDPNAAATIDVAYDQRPKSI